MLECNSSIIRWLDADLLPGRLDLPMQASNHHSSSSSSLEVILAKVPFLLDLLLEANTVWSERKQGIDTLSLVSKDARSSVLRRVRSLSLDLTQPTDYSSFVMFMSTLHPQKLQLTLCPDSDERLKGLLRDLGQCVVGGITHLVLEADTDDLLRSGADTVAGALAAMPGLKHVSLVGEPLLLAPHVMATLLSGMTHLEKLTVSNITLGPLFKPFLLAIHACSRLQRMDLQVNGLKLIRDSECSLPPSVRELRFNGTVSVQLSTNGFFSTLHTLTLAALPPGHTNLNHFLSTATSLQQLTLTAEERIPNITCTVALPQGFQLATNTVALCGESGNDIREILALVSLLDVHTCTIVFGRTQPELGADFMNEFPCKCPAVKKVIFTYCCLHQMGPLGYTGDEGFLAPLARCRSLTCLTMCFALPEGTREGLCGALLSIPSLDHFSGVKSAGLDKEEVAAEMAAMGRGCTVILKEEDWMDWSWLFVGGCSHERQHV